MIDEKCFTLDWINEQKQILGRIDAGILEKSIFALALLGNLAESGLPFVFKGGTSLLLHLNPIRRLSIDIDIFCSANPKELDEVLAVIAGLAPFVGYEEQDRGNRGLPSRRHFKFFYDSPTQKLRRHFILLDVVEERECPVPLIQKVIRVPFIILEREVVVNIPTVEGLLGDKLTAFAPHTTGVPFWPANKKPCDTMQVIKQLFDVAELFDVMQDLPQTSNAYDAMLNLENGYRGNGFTREQVLNDSRDACLAMAMHGFRGVPENQDAVMLHDGARRLANHLVSASFNLDDARIAAGKTALLLTILLKQTTDIDLHTLRYDSGPVALASLGEKEIVAPWQPLNKLKGPNTEAFFYWHRAQEIEQQG